MNVIYLMNKSNDVLEQIKNECFKKKKTNYECLFVYRKGKSDA